MAIKVNEMLESIGYKNLFEYIKKEGIEPVLNLVMDIQKLPDKKTLIYETVMGNENNLVLLAKKHHDVIRYFNEYQNKFNTLRFHSESLQEVLLTLSKKPELIDTYLENSRKLEALKVFRINFVEYFGCSYESHIYEDENNKIINIHKYYSDGEFNCGSPISRGKLSDISHYTIHFTISEDKTFVLHCQNTEDFCQYRWIDIKDFGFNGKNLPSEEEVETYEVPLQLIKKKLY